MTSPLFAAVKRQITALCYGLAWSMCLFVTSGFADDTEVFYAQIENTTSEASSSPNVLFVLDNSLSMLESDEGQEGSRMTRLRIAMDEILTRADDDVKIGIVTLNGDNGGGPVRYPVAPLGDSVCDGSDCGTVFIRTEIDNGDNDVIENVNSGNVTTDGAELTIGFADGGAGEEQIVGLRFEGVGIPQGAVITNARLRLNVQQSYEFSGGITVWGDDSDSAEPFTASANDLSNRDKTDASVTYGQNSWTAGDTYPSGLLDSIIQEIVNRPGWCGGNDLAFMLSATESRSLFSAEGVSSTNGGNAASLQLTYDASTLAENEGCVYQTDVYQVYRTDDDGVQSLSTGETSIRGRTLAFPENNSDLTIAAFRFQDIDVPKGAEIAEARVEFSVASSGQGTPRVSINAENTSNSSALSNSRNRISGQAQTTASVIWEQSGEALAGSKIYTSDLSPVAEEIFALEGWAPGNAMTIRLQGESSAGYHNVRSFRSNPKTAPRLYLKKKTYVGKGDTGLADFTVRDDLKNLIDGLRTNYYTPMLGAQYEAAQYLTGGPVDFGRKRGGDLISSNFRVSHPDSYSGGELYTPENCESFDPYATECAAEEILDAGDAGAQYISPMLDACQTNHIVILGDGAVGNDRTKSKIHELIGNSSCTNVTAGDTNCASALSEYLYETDLNPDFGGMQNIRTHTVAFNLDGAGAAFYDDIARKGGGQSRNADSADELVTAFTSIIEGALSVNTSFAAPAVTVNQFNRLSHRDDLYYAVFKPSDTPLWSGNLKRYKLGELDEQTAILDYYDNDAVDDSTGYFSDSARSFWTHLDSDGGVSQSADGAAVAEGGVASRIGANGIDNRNVYTVIDADAALASGGVTLMGDNHKLHEGNETITSTRLGISAISDEDREDYRQDLLKWARGVDISDSDNDSDTEEPRRHIGDPLHSNPVIVNYETLGSEDDKSIVYITTNEGFLHAIDSATGDELWAFSPEELLENHYLFYNNATETTHPYGLDGPLTLYRNESNDDLVIEDGESVYLYSAMRRGGNNYYAFDISDPDSPVLAWVIKGGPGGTPGFAELGQSWSEATTSRILFEGVERNVLIFGAGYDVNQDANALRDGNGNTVTMEQTDDSIGRGLFIVDAVTGELIWSVSGPDAGTDSTADQQFDDMRFGMPGGIRLLDVDYDGLVDQMYASDTGGQLWRFDVVGDGSESSNLLQGGVVADISTTPASGQRRFYSEPDVALIKENGRSYIAISIGSGWRDHPLNDVVSDAYYLVRSYDVTSVPAGYGTQSSITGSWRPITESDLYQVNSASVVATADYSNGWFLRLPDAGEKVLASSIIFNNYVYFTTYVPDADVAACSAGIGGGYFYGLSVFDGSPILDFDEDGSVENYGESGSSDDMRYALKHAGLPSSPSLLIASGQSPEVFVGIEKVPTDITNETSRTFWVDSGTD